MSRTLRIVAGSVATALAAWLLVAGVAARGRAEAAADPRWTMLEPGLDFGEFEAPRPAPVGDSRIRALRIDPARFELRLAMSSALPGHPRASVRGWAEKSGFLAAINASMFQQDLKTSVSLMKTRAHTNNARLSRDRAVLAFDRLDPAVPPVQILDRDLQVYEELAPKYGSLVQSIRMLALDGRNVWAPQSQAYSIAAIGVDHDGRVLFLHCRSPFTPHDFIEQLLALPLRLKNAMYVEGGPTAQLYVGAGGRTLEFLGGYESGLVAGGIGAPVPNVVGVVRR